MKPYWNRVWDGGGGCKRGMLFGFCPFTPWQCCCVCQPLLAGLNGPVFVLVLCVSVDCCKLHCRGRQVLAAGDEGGGGWIWCCCCCCCIMGTLVWGCG